MTGRRWTMRVWDLARCGLAIALGGAGLAQVTQRVSVSSAGEQGNYLSGSGYPAISSDGRFIAFVSFATNLVDGDTNFSADVFVRDRRMGPTERVSVDSAGLEGNDESWSPSISADGRYVAFASQSDNLVPGDTNSSYDVFVRDRRRGITARVSVGPAGAQANRPSAGASISADGRYVAFYSGADNLVPGDTNFVWDIFVRDLQNGVTERVNVDSTGGQASGPYGSYDAKISADGRYVVFRSLQTNLVPGDTNAASDIFVRDRQTGTTERVSVDSAGTQADADSFWPSISADGRYVAFYSGADNLVPGDTNFAWDIFVRDRQGGTTECASLDPNGAHVIGSSYEPFLSAEGRYVAFSSNSITLVGGGDANAYVSDVYVRDRQLGVTSRESVDSAGIQGNDESYAGAISPDGRLVAILSHADNLVHDDTNATKDVFLRDRVGGPDFASFCIPGAGGVIACPCGNPPGGPDRGCDNSSATGGAALSASGGTFLSSDSLVFETSGEKPNALSILMQGNGVIPSGVIYGQGVRCLGGTIIRRLFTAQASGGSITAPDFGVGESTVSARSAAKGDVIQPGQSRSYLVYYRDPIVLGGCPASRTFNATQTGLVSWAP
jgi:Tol biopolymer transport system component